MSLLTTAEALWQEAYRCIHNGLHKDLPSPPTIPLDDEQRTAALKRASQYLHAGLELVLPTALEVRFRLLLARLLLRHTTDGALDAREHLRKCLQLIKSVNIQYECGR